MEGVQKVLTPNKAIAGKGKKQVGIITSITRGNVQGISQ